MTSKHVLLIISLISAAAGLFAEDSRIRIEPEKRESELLNAEYKNDEEKHKAYIEAAEIRMLTGNIKGAAELYEKASYAVKGKKDFESLLKASALYIEMASYRKAEAGLRAVLTFADSADLRISASILSARIKILQDDRPGALSIISTVTASSESLPAYAGYFIAEYLTEDEKAGLGLTEEALVLISDHAQTPRIITPEVFFGGFADAAEIETVKPPAAPVQETAAGIQLGSFSEKVNADDMLGTVKSAGYNAQIREKDVNGKKYFSVVIPVNDNSEIQKLIIELKEKGYEGYPVY